MKISKILASIDHNHLCALSALVISASSVAIITYDNKYINDLFNASEIISFFVLMSQMTIKTVNQGASQLLETTQLWSTAVINEFKNVNTGIINIYTQLQTWIKNLQKTLPSLLKENSRKKIIFYISKIPELPLLIIKYLDFILELHKKSFGFANEVLSDPNFTTLITAMKDLSITKSEVMGSLNQEGLAKIADYLVEDNKKTSERIQKMIKKTKELMWSKEFFNNPETIINTLTENHVPKRRQRSATEWKNNNRYKNTGNGNTQKKNKSTNNQNNSHKIEEQKGAKDQKKEKKENEGNKQMQMNKKLNTLENLKTLLDKNMPEVIVQNINKVFNEIKNLINSNQISNEVINQKPIQSIDGEVISDAADLSASGLEEKDTNAINEEDGEEIEEKKIEELKESQFQKYIKEAIKMIIEKTSGEIETKKLENLKSINSIAEDLEKIWKLLISQENQI